MTTRDLICPVCQGHAVVSQGYTGRWIGECLNTSCYFVIGALDTEQDALTAWEAVCWTLAKDKLAPEVRHKADLPCDCLDHVLPTCEHHKALRVGR